MLQTGTRLDDRYTLEDLVARGGMGEIWRAHDPVLGRTVAVKVLLPNLSADPDFAARFRAEARAMAALSHPGIVDIYDYGQAEGIAYLVMQFVDGESLRTMMTREGPLAPKVAMGLVAQAARALHVAHVQGIVHRDVKPGNLLLHPDGRLVLTDFGIAQLLTGDRLTAAGDVLGTAAYLAPEQVNGSPTTPATDVYALGIVAYELLTQARPFEGDTPMAVALKHIREEPPPLPTEIPATIRNVVMRALAKEPGLRWSTAAAMADAAVKAAEGANAPVDEPPVPVAPPRRRRRRILISVAAVVLLAVAGGLVSLRPGAIGAQRAPWSIGPAESPPTDGSLGTLEASADGDGVSPIPGTTYVAGNGPGIQPGTQPGTQPGAGGSTSAHPSTSSSGPGAPPPTSTEPAPPPDIKQRPVPDVRGVSEGPAVSILENNEFQAYVKHVPDMDNCTVRSQSPAAGELAPVGSVVTIVVTSGDPFCPVLS